MVNEVEIDEKNVIRLSKTENNHFRKYTPFQRFNPYRNLNEFLEEAKFQSTKIPDRILRKLIHFSMFGNKDGAIVVENLPLDPYIPPTPTRPNERLGKETYLSEMILSIFGTVLGEPFGYAEEKNGEIFQTIYPTLPGVKIQSNESSEIFLKFHTENAPELVRPDYVLLYCLRQDPAKKAKTYFASALDIVDKLTDNEFEALKEKKFYPQNLPSFGGKQESVNIEPCAILRGSKTNPRIRYDYFMKGESLKQDKLLQHVEEYANLKKKFVILKPGSLLIINNNTTLHARSEFTARLNGEDRLTQRLYVIKSLEFALEHFTSDRIIRMI